MEERIWKIQASKDGKLVYQGISWGTDEYEALNRWDERLKCEGIIFDTLTATYPASIYDDIGVIDEEKYKYTQEEAKKYIAIGVASLKDRDLFPRTPRA